MDYVHDSVNSKKKKGGEPVKMSTLGSFHMFKKMPVNTVCILLKGQYHQDQHGME